MWFNAGYGIALWKDGPGPIFERHDAQITIQHPVYPGYAQAVNRLVAMVFEYDPDADFVVIGGDDVEPDMNHPPGNIAESLVKHFGGTFGVCQPTADRWGDSPASRRKFGEDRGAYIDRVCGTAWLGREFCKRAYRGNGPLWPEYVHQYVDEELQCVAERLGILWQRRDLIQLHRHWGRGPVGDDNALQNAEIVMPEFLHEANSAAHWSKFKKLFEERRAAGFPGHELLK